MTTCTEPRCPVSADYRVWLAHNPQLAHHLCLMHAQKFAHVANMSGWGEVVYSRSLHSAPDRIPLGTFEPASPTATGVKAKTKRSIAKVAWTGGGYVAAAILVFEILAIGSGQAGATGARLGLIDIVGTALIWWPIAAGVIAAVTWIHRMVD